MKVQKYVPNNEIRLHNVDIWNVDNPPQINERENGRM
jgi:hypothetical protein